MIFSIHQAAEEAPHQPALVITNKTYTFHQLIPYVNSTIDWLTHRSATLGILRPRVAFGVGDPFRTAILLYALAELGWCAVPIHAKLPSATQKRLFASIPNGLLLPEDWCVPPPSNTIKTTLFPIDSSKELLVVHTSGSTGTARGVRLSRGAMHASAQASSNHLGWLKSDRWLCVLPLGHIGGLSILYRCLLGRSCCVLSPSTKTFDATQVISQVSTLQISLLSLVPTMLVRLLDHAWTPPAHVRAVLIGGASCAPEILHKAKQHHIPFLTTYGSTETCAQVCTQTYESAGTLQPGVGKPLSGVELTISHQNTLRIRCASLFSGYLNNNAQPPGDGWYETNDVGFLDPQGHVHITGRADTVIITGGENVHPQYVEQVLEHHPSVLRACVFPQPDNTWGQRIVAAIVPKRSQNRPPASQIDELRAFVQSRLASYQQPREWYVVTSLPLLPSGKLDRYNVPDFVLAEQIATRAL